MDNFMDKLAQKFTAGDMIRANSAAEAKELKRLRQQTEMYENCLAEMQKLHLKNVQAADELQKLTEEIRQNLQTVARESRQSLQSVTQESLKQLSAMIPEKKEDGLYQRLENLQKQMEDNQKKNEELFRQADDYLHKENVKVYRNVQAVVVDQLNMKTDAITESQKKMAAKYGKAAIVLLVLTFLAAAGHLALWLLQLYGILGL